MKKNLQVIKGGRRPTTKDRKVIDIQVLAQTLVTDPIYLRKLQLRLRAGKAGALESLFWQMAFGKPDEPISPQPDLSKLSDEEIKQLMVLMNRMT